MKKLEERITEILTPHLSAPGGTALGATPLDVVTDIIKAINDYFHNIEEATCYLLELLPDGEVSIRRQVTETCALRYSVSKE